MVWFLQAGVERTSLLLCCSPVICGIVSVVVVCAMTAWDDVRLENIKK